MDYLLEKGQVTPADSEESLEIYREVQEILHREQPSSLLTMRKRLALSAMKYRAGRFTLILPIHGLKLTILSS